MHKAHGNRWERLRSRVVLATVCGLLGAFLSVFAGIGTAQPYNQPPPPSVSPSTFQSPSNPPSSPSPSMSSAPASPTISPSVLPTVIQTSPDDEVESTGPTGPGGGDEGGTIVQERGGILALTGGEITRYLLLGAMAVALGITILQAAKRRRNVLG